MASVIRVEGNTEVYAIHVGRTGLPDGHIGNCPIDHGPLFFSNTTWKGRFALCRERHVFEVDYKGGFYGQLKRLKGAKSIDIRGW